MLYGVRELASALRPEASFRPWRTGALKAAASCRTPKALADREPFSSTFVGRNLTLAAFEKHEVCGTRCAIHVQIAGFA
jgi:hypothetical protein